MDVDEDEEDGDKKGHPPRDDLRVDKETGKASCQWLWLSTKQKQT